MEVTKEHIMRQDSLDKIVKFIKNTQTKDGPKFQDHDDFKNMTDDEWADVVTRMKKIFDSLEEDKFMGDKTFMNFTDRIRYPKYYEKKNRLKSLDEDGPLEYEPTTDVNRY
jgi:hypothetical protein